MVVKFYYHPMSPSSQCVWLILKELGIDYEEEVVDMFSGKHKTEEYKAINPYQRLPAITDGDLKLAESTAIVIYLCTKYEPTDKAEKLYPKDPTEAAKLNMAIFHNLDNLQAIQKYLNGKAIYAGKAAGPLEEEFPTVQAVLTEMNDTLAEKKYLAGDHRTLLDFCSLITIGVLSFTGFDGWDEYPHLQRWRGKMQELSYLEECHTKYIRQSIQMFKDFAQKAAATLAEQKT